MSPLSLAYDNARPTGGRVFRSVVFEPASDVGLWKASCEYLRIYGDGESATPKAKRYDIRYFRVFIHKRRGRCMITDISTEDLRTYIDARFNLGESPATVERRYSTVKHFFRWLSETRIDFRSPCPGVKSPRVSRPKPKRMKDADVEAMLDSLNESIPSQLELKVMISLSGHCGLRAADLRMLTEAHILLDEFMIRNLVRKGKLIRDLPFSDEDARLLELYLPQRRKLLESKVFRFSSLPAEMQRRYPLFPSTYGAIRKNTRAPEMWRLNPKAIYQRIRQVGENVGVKVHPHLFRHYFGHRMLEETNDLRLTAQALQHDDVKSTLRYTERGPEAVRAVINQGNFLRRTRQ